VVPLHKIIFFDTFTVGETPTVSFFIYKQRERIYIITGRKEEEKRKEKKGEQQ
jgi:hypothetical protein